LKMTTPDNTKHPIERPMMMLRISKRSERGDGHVPRLPLSFLASGYDITHCGQVKLRWRKRSEDRGKRLKDPCQEEGLLLGGN
jgi:hypothetical protein